MEFGLFLCCLLGVVILPVVNNAAVTLTTPAHHTQPIGQDHLLIVLTSMHQSDTFHKLSSREKIFLVELLAAAEVDAVTHYIDSVGFDKFLQFLDVVTKLNATEAHLLEHYMVQELNQETPDGSGSGVIGRKRDLATMLAAVQNNPAAQALPADDKALLEELIRAAETHTLTPVIHREGYAKIVQLIEDIGTVTETHTFITYLVVGNRQMVKSKSASCRPGYLSSVADEKRYLQSAKSSQSSRWNNSSQGLRLEKEWTDLATSRSLKRNSEIVTHRVDRMYFMTGNSISIKPKYQVDEDELNHLRELSKSRQSSRRQSRNSRNSKKGQQSQLEDELKALSVKEGNGNADKNENDELENSTEKNETNRQKSPLAGWSLTENPGVEPEPDQKETLSRLSLHEDPEGKSPSEEAQSVRDNADQMTNDEDDGFHEMEMKGRADGRQEVEDVLDPDPENVSPEEDPAEKEVEGEQ